MKCRNCKHLGWDEEYPGKPFFGWCDRVNDSVDTDIEGDCELFEPATNADVIRRMSDEELAKHIWPKFGCPNGKNNVTCGYVGNCIDCWLEWLRQPAKEDK